MMEKTLILKHISGMLCLLISYSKFTRTSPIFTLKKIYSHVILNIEKGKARDAAYPEHYSINLL